MESPMTERVSLEVACEPRLARLVRMTAANVAMLSSMSVDRIEDIRMAAEEAFVCACSVMPGDMLTISFEVDAEHVAMTFELGDVDIEAAFATTEGAYADLILSAVCDSYSRDASPAALHLNLRADV